MIAIALAFVGALGSACATDAPDSAAGRPDETPSTTVVVVRHAEKEDRPDDPDPPLSAVGIERATLLARMFGDTPIAAAYASEYERTQATVRPLAAHHGIDVTVHPAADFAGLADVIRVRHAGATVVVAGHSNTVPAIIEALGGGPVEPIDESVYDNLYVVTLGPAGPRSLVRLRYGAPTEPEP